MVLGTCNSRGILLLWIMVGQWPIVLQKARVGVVWILVLVYYWGLFGYFFDCHISFLQSSGKPFDTD